MYPETVTTLMALTLNLLTFPLSQGNFMGFRGLGFAVIPKVTVCVQIFEVFALMFMARHLNISWVFCWNDLFTNIITRKRIKEYLRCWTPAVVTIACDTWRLNFIGFIASYYGVEFIAAYNIAAKMMQFSHQLVSALGVATAIRVGHHLGAESRNLARKTCWLGMGIAVVCATVLCLVPLLIPKILGRVFTTDEVVMGIVKNARFAMATATFTMSLSVCYSNIMIGQGRPCETMTTSFVSSLFVHVPVCICLLILFRTGKAELPALFWGISAAFTTSTAMSFYFLVFKTNWSRLIDNAVYRANLHAYSTKRKSPKVNTKLSTWHQVFTDEFEDSL